MKPIVYYQIQRLNNNMTMHAELSPNKKLRTRESTLTIVFTSMDTMVKNSIDQTGNNTKHMNIRMDLINGLDKREDRNIRNLRRQIRTKVNKLMRICFHHPPSMIKSLRCIMKWGEISKGSKKRIRQRKLQL